MTSCNGPIEPTDLLYLEGPDLAEYQPSVKLFVLPWMLCRVYFEMIDLAGACSLGYAFEGERLCGFCMAWTCVIYGLLRDCYLLLHTGTLFFSGIYRRRVIVNY